MRVIVFVNHHAEVRFRQTTALLVAALIRANCEVFIASVDGLSLFADDETLASVTGIVVPEQCVSSGEVAKFAMENKLERSITVSDQDLVLIRTNPGRDQGRTLLHSSLLHNLKILQSRGTRVVNDPQHLGFFASKASLAMLDPSHRPPMLVGHNESEIAGFVRDAPSFCIIKPLIGSRGQNVVRVHSRNAELEKVISMACRRGPCVVQRFIESDKPGDQRVVVMHGQILKHEGVEAGIYRKPADDDFRGNLHAGGTAQPLQLSDSARASVLHAAQILQSHGIVLAGVDLVGDQIIETNVFSTGGLLDANRFAGFDFTDHVVSALLDNHRNRWS